MKNASRATTSQKRGVRRAECARLLGEGRISYSGATSCPLCSEHYYWDDVVGCGFLTGDPDYTNATISGNRSVFRSCCKSSGDLAGFDVDEEISSAVCREGTAGSSIVVNPGWWRHGPASSSIYKCKNGDCRSTGGEATKEDPFGTLRDEKGAVKSVDVREGSSNGTRGDLAKNSRMGQCALCAQKERFGTQRMRLVSVLRAKNGGLLKMWSEVPPRSWFFFGFILFLMWAAHEVKVMIALKREKKKRRWSTRIMPWRILKVS